MFNTNNNNSEILSGMPVLAVNPGSPSEKAGLRAGDRVIIANGMQVKDLDSFVKARNLRNDGLDVTVMRGFKMLDLKWSFDNASEKEV